MIRESPLSKWERIQRLLPDGDFMKSAISLITQLEKAGGFPPSSEFQRYSERVRSIMSGLSKDEAVEFILNIDTVSKALAQAKWVALYPPLKEYAVRFHPGPDLLVILFSEASTVGDTDHAEEYLRQAYHLDPQNEYVLWQLLISQAAPWFPKDLIPENDPREAELSVVRKLLLRNPDDPLALIVREHITTSKRPLSDKENIRFFNSLTRLVPHPLRNEDLRHMLEA